VALFAIWERYRLRVFENRRAEEEEKLMKLRNDKLHYMLSPQNISWVIKSRQMRWLVHGARMGEKRNTYRIFVRNLKGEDRLGNLGVYVRITLKPI
jgi:hypothetical protein